MKKELIELVRQRAKMRCEYCRLHQDHVQTPFQFDHVIAEQHGGKATPENLALACMRCNKNKGPNIASLDPENSSFTLLFNPRTDEWIEHFVFEGPYVRDTTPRGRATVRLLAMNDAARVLLRQQLLREGILTPGIGF
jgi:hypothetical protein